MWKAAAGDTMAQAAITAGIVSKQQLNNLLIISEPEAAALYCESIFVENFKKKAGSTFIVCDAGGGTVDLVTFRFVEENNGDLVICQVGEGVGDLCGSTYLDKKFKEYLENFYEHIRYDHGNLDFSRAMKDFETEIKVKKHNIHTFFFFV
jgi:molecular chaperone DnaK (HSP70)